MRILDDVHLPIDSSVSVFTEGLLGDNYLNIAPGFSQEMVQTKGVIDRTHGALVLEEVIG